MESQHQKWVNLSYLAVSIITGYVFFSLAMKGVGIWDLESRMGIRHIELVIQGISVLLGAILMFVLWRHDQANQFMNEVVVELSRVTWPTQKETTSGTIVVIVMVLISGLILGLLDYLWTVLLKMVL